MQETDRIKDTLHADDTNEKGVIVITASEKRVQLKKMLLSGETYPIPGVYDCVSAKVAEAAGYKAIYLGSFATSASLLGLPDTGNVTLTEMVNHTRNIANATKLPLIVDVEGGFFEAANICRTVQELEQAGASAIHIEDHIFGKHTELKPVIADVDIVCNKIRAAVDARCDSNFLIIGRTDSYYATKDIEDSIYRANKFLEAGADAAFISGKIEPALLVKHRKRINGPLVTTPSGASVEEERNAGINLVLYWPMMLYAALQACKEAAQMFMDTGDMKKLGKYVYNDEEFCKYIPSSDFTKRARNYMASVTRD